MINLLGWIGAVAFVICAIPQAYKSYQDGHARGVSAGFLWLWTLGEVCMLVYSIPLGSWPLIFNYVFNLLFLSIVIRYKYWERQINVQEPKTFYICGVDWQHELGHTMVTTYGSERSFKACRTCGAYCGIVKVTIDESNATWVVPQNFDKYLRSKNE